MNTEQEQFMSLLKQKMDELQGIIRHVPQLFGDQITPCIYSDGNILNVNLNWSFQSSTDNEPVELVLEQFRVGNYECTRHTWPSYKWNLVEYKGGTNE